MIHRSRRDPATSRRPAGQGGCDGVIALLNPLGLAGPRTTAPSATCWTAEKKALWKEGGPPLSRPRAPRCGPGQDTRPAVEKLRSFGRSRHPRSQSVGHCIKPQTAGAPTEQAHLQPIGGRAAPTEASALATDRREGRRPDRSKRTCNRSEQGSPPRPKQAHLQPIGGRVAAPTEASALATDRGKGRPMMTTGRHMASRRIAGRGRPY